MSECETPEPELGAGGPAPEDTTEDELQEMIDKLCQLVELLIASDPDGDGILNIEGMVEVSLEGQCLTITNCEGDALTVELSAETIAELTSSLTTSLAETCLQFKQCDGEVFNVAIAPGEEPIPVEIDCVILGAPITGCLDGVCVEGVQVVEHIKSTGVTTVLGNTLPAGASPEPCPEVIVVTLPTSCCDKRIILDGDATHDINALLGVGPGVTVPSFSLTVQTLANKASGVTLVDCDGNKSDAFCGENISYSGGCADQNSLISLVATSAGDRVILEARVCPPLEATP